jgi:hypothetical protein
MNLIDYIYAVFPNLGEYSHLINQAPDVIHRLIGCSIQFVDVVGTRFIEGFARFTLFTGFDAFRQVKTVKGFRKDPGAGGFTYTPRTAEKVCMGYLP